MTREEAKSCIGTIELLQRLAYNIHGVMDVIDADNCKKIIKALEQEPNKDCISRAEAIKCLECDFKITGRENMKTVVNYINSVHNKIVNLPSVKQEPTTNYDLGVDAVL